MVAIFGVIGLVVGGGVFISFTPLHTPPFRQKEYDQTLQEARYLEEQGRLQGALGAYRHASGLYLLHWHVPNPKIEDDVDRLKERVILRAAGKDAFKRFVEDLESAKAEDLRELLRKGRGLREAYRDHDLAWLSELERILDRLEKVGRTSIEK